MQGVSRACPFRYLCVVKETDRIPSPRPILARVEGIRSSQKPDSGEFRISDTAWLLFQTLKTPEISNISHVFRIGVRSSGKRVRGKQSNTVAKRFRFLNTFFNKLGITMIKDQRNPNGLINRSEVPVEEKPKHINRYSVAEIKEMLSVADDNQTDLIQLFLRTGVRDEEAAFLTWADIDFKGKQIFIREKPGIWKPKDKEQRIIPVEDGVLLPRLEARRKRQSPARSLVFPNTLAGPDMHLIHHLHKVIAKLKLRGVEIEGVATLHRFRRTYASMMISHSDLQTVSSLLGHSDIETTSRYLAPDQSKARIGTRTAFQGMGD